MISDVTIGTRSLRLARSSGSWRNPEESRNMAVRAREVGTQLADLGLQIACVGLEPVHGLLSYLER